MVLMVYGILSAVVWLKLNIRKQSAVLKPRESSLTLICNVLSSTKGRAKNMLRNYKRHVLVTFIFSLLIVLGANDGCIRQTRLQADHRTRTIEKGNRYAIKLGVLTSYTKA